MSQERFAKGERNGPSPATASRDAHAERRTPEALAWGRGPFLILAGIGEPVLNGPRHEHPLAPRSRHHGCRPPPGARLPAWPLGRLGAGRPVHADHRRDERAFGVGPWP